MYSWVFRVTFFAFCAPFFACCISCCGWNLREKSKDFVVYFFAALMKHKIRVKYKKRIASVPYFVVCFAKTFAKYSQNVKYKKCIAGLTAHRMHSSFPIPHRIHFALLSNQVVPFFATVRCLHNMQLFPLLKTLKIPTLIIYTYFSILHCTVVFNLSNQVHPFLKRGQKYWQNIYKIRII